MFSEIKDALKIMEEDDTRVILLRGKGKSFSSGADINYMLEMSDSDYEENLTEAARLAELFFSLYSCPKPLVSVVHGITSGGAIGILATSDICIASEESKFSLGELRLGLVPAAISPYIILKMGTSKCRELCLTGRQFSSCEAMDYGLINYVAENDSLEEKIGEICSQLLLASPSAVRKTKKLFNEFEREDLNRNVVNYTTSIIAKSRASADGLEGLKAFIEKRQANWIKEGK
jgi:methylglutaconyl-CoA hydratase